MSAQWSPPPASKHARSREEAVLIAGGPVICPRKTEPHVPDLAFVRDGMPSRSERSAYLVHALRFFEDVLAYAERLEHSAVTGEDPS